MLALKISSRDRKKLLNNLKFGVVPRKGMHHIQVGRAKEIKSLISELDNVVDGSTSFRIVVGEYGSGKSFFLGLNKEIAHQKDLCVVNADLAPEKRLYSTSGQARSLYSELVRNLSTKTKPDGDALQTIVEKFLETCAENSFKQREKSVSKYSLGFELISVLRSYKSGFESGDNSVCYSALKWIRGEYSTKTEASRELGVRIIINDDNYFDALKAISSLVVEVGYKGLVICIDEMINLMRITQTSSRKNNYEQLLRILNDLLQGSCSHMAVMLSGTPDFLTDERKGLYTYEALKSRLQENEFLEEGFFDPNHPVIRLKPLTSEEIFNLVSRVRDIYDSGDSISNKGDDQLVVDYLAHCRSKLGSQLFTSPRNVIRGYLNLRDVIEGNPSCNTTELLQSSEIEPDLDPDIHLNEDTDDDLVDFQLNG